MKSRNDDFLERRKHLSKYSDSELKAYFQELTDQIIDPLLTLAYENTTPAIERSVLMRMGFSSLEAKMITDKLMENNLLSHGAGHIVFKYATLKKLPIREAGLALLDTSEVNMMMEVFK
ncbi:MAG: ornithine aminomutase [Tenericutes bacterium HGW-Tenericutes-2]|jgi:D-ornithine 4,5-aminomutase subunit alpha|nr:MAG: ornithine aminomutase [Tenericutes bacterium HGW-Tenericutes-2]